MIAAYSANLGICSIIMAELWAIYIGVKMAYNIGAQRLLVESDSLCVIGLLHQRSFGVSFKLISCESH